MNFISLVPSIMDGSPYHKKNVEGVPPFRQKLHSPSSKLMIWGGSLVALT
jgi:hypothetical protein